MKMNNSNPETQRRRRPRSRTAGVLLYSSAVAAILAHYVKPSQCFQTSRRRPQSSRPRSTSVSFRSESTSPSFVLPSESSAVVGPNNDLFEHSLPSWLALPRSHMVDSNLEALKNAMCNDSFFTESETRKLFAAIKDAARGDMNKVAGAAEFCLILVETAEMGLNALVAAAYHYASCFEARERTFGPSPSGEWLAPLDASTQSTLQSYGGAHAVEIVQDAARLKHLEVVAAAVLEKETASRVRPDSRDAENLRKLLLSETRDWRALAIRSAACLYRLRGILHSGEDRSILTMRTAREALLIYAPLASRLGMHRLKNELEGAAFRILYPRQYRLVNQFTHEHIAGHNNDIGTSMKQVLEAVREDMTVMLENDPEFSQLVDKFSVTARVKEPYSLWKKMLRRGYKSMLQVPDVLALRIVIDSKKLDEHEDDQVTQARERALCYYVQNLCQQRWRPAADPRFKDYIASPKSNGYQSLHYTATTEWYGHDWPFEVQVRSGAMHNIAEFGFGVAHYDYKLSQEPSNVDTESDFSMQQHHEYGSQLDNDNSSAAYLRNVQEWHWQQHGGTRMLSEDASPVSSDSAAGFDIWQNRMRAARIRERTQRLEPYIQALKTAQWDLARDYVFIFCSDENSQVLALPAGSCVLDALKEVKRDDSHILLNGSATSITRQLHNGDVLAF